MKKIIAWPVTWAMFWMGHWISKPLNRYDCMSWLYPAYNWLMNKSVAVQDWGGLKAPWGQPRYK